MEIQLPENMDWSRPGQYLLVLDVSAEQFSFRIYDAADEEERFAYRLTGDASSDAFSQFREAFFAHDFFTYPFRTIRIVNHTPVFTCVPNLLFEEKDKEAYLQFLFADASGQFLHQTLLNPEMTIVHNLPDEVYGFLQRSCPEASIEHYTTAFIEWCQAMDLPAPGNRMFLFGEKGGIHVLGFSHRQLLLSNYFRCESADEAVYYALYLFKQLKFNQLKDYVYLVKTEKALEDAVGKYVQNVTVCENFKNFR
ncbi:MAG: DUF3822 family protein [Dysgonamonadaceae bacterium]|jgi:hypothetical protein|nr:DUF3822 family protein [Dysgonamonadaceae bacterium]